MIVKNPLVLSVIILNFDSQSVAIQHMSYSNKTHVILLKDKSGQWNVCTEKICLVKEDKPSRTFFVYFKKEELEFDNKKSRLRQYSKKSVVVLKDPIALNPCEYTVFHQGEPQENVYAICHFDKNPDFNYWTIAFQDSRPDIVCNDDEIRVVRSAAAATKSKDVLKYLTQMAYLHHYDIRFGEEKKVLLGEQFDHLRRGDMAPLLEAFLAPDGFKNSKKRVCEVPIYPFCSNSSQIDAVNQALSNQVSVIQGPPGTGKTETILNILMNLVVNGKTAMVVAGSNSATDNILDKLKEEELDFLVARLGSKSNKEAFIKTQLTDNLCPDEWFNKTFDTDGTLKRIKELSNELKYLYAKDVDLHKAIERGDKSEEQDLRLELEKSDYRGKCQQLKSLSEAYVKYLMYVRYGGNHERGVYSFDDIGEESTRYNEFLNDYPIVLSTAYSATKCVAVSSIVDYIIMDEASQIDLVTGLLALSVAKNAVIVGDDKQLPNVIKKEMADVSQEIFHFFDIDDRFNYATRNILQSVCKTPLGAPETLLKEHYRCHPKIARFFNNEFYGGELVCMREDKGEENVLILRQTVPGNHAADFTNNREEEEMEDVISDYDIPEDEYLVGIIAPYNNQVRRIRKDEDIDEDFEVYTVHKYQGRQRDTIIISTVDNRYSDFVNDAHLLNVSVSRAKNQLVLVTNGNEGNTGHMKNLVDYFKANGICESGEITSLFDLIYPQYTVQLENYLNTRPAIPSYFYAPGDEPSKAEQIAYRFISKVLQDYPNFSIQYECPLRILVKDRSAFDEKELKLISDKRSHVDFLIVNKKTSKRVLAIEIDGESYHIEDTFHWQKDRLKDSIMGKCGIPLHRFRTKESINEEETLKEILTNKIL